MPQCTPPSTTIKNCVICFFGTKKNNQGKKKQHKSPSTDKDVSHILTVIVFSPKKGMKFCHLQQSECKWRSLG
jgi:hypothetical protein